MYRTLSWRGLGLCTIRWATIARLLCVGILQGQSLRLLSSPVIPLPFCWRRLRLSWAEQGKGIVKLTGLGQLGSKCHTINVTGLLVGTQWLLEKHFKTCTQLVQYQSNRSLIRVAPRFERWKCRKFEANLLVLFHHIFTIWTDHFSPFTRSRKHFSDKLL